MSNSKKDLVNNTSGLIPVGHAVLVEPYEPEVKKSLIALPDAVKERSAMIETRAIVIAVGDAAWEDEKVPRAMVGDKVLISKFAGVMAQGPEDQKQYRLINDRDIYCRIKE
jgi:co-chaperonin GroES (HSP10)